MYGGEEIVVVGSGGRCGLCRKRWKDEFPAAPLGCFFAGRENDDDEPAFFDLATGRPAACKGPEPPLDSQVAYVILDVLEHCHTQTTGDGGGISLQAAFAIMGKLYPSVPLDEVWLSLWTAASDELLKMKYEAQKTK